MERNLRKEILDANRAVHDLEAQFYDVIHGEIFNDFEQARLSRGIARADALVDNNQRKALDLGAGTGNLTTKLLALGYQVTAVDISSNMIRALEKKFTNHVAVDRLTPVVGDLEELDFESRCFDFVGCYSVLHHLPNYCNVVRKLGSLTKHGGVMFLDHEASEEYWTRSQFESIVASARDASDRILNRVYMKMALGSREAPKLDYSVSDYWTKRERHIDHELIRRTIAGMGFRYAVRETYHLNRCFYPNPFFHAYRNLCRPDYACWVAKK